MAMPGASPTIQVAGNVEGSIVIGDNNFVVNNNHGTIVYKQAQPQVRLRSMAPRPPRAPRTFLGREREIAALVELIAENAPVELTGAEGVGKSYLLKRVANEDAAQNRPNGVVFLEGIDPSGTILAWEDLQQQLFDALFESDPTLKVTPASARTYLSNTSPLVLLDNLQLPPEALENLADLFPQAPVLAVPNQPLDSDVFEPFKVDPLSMSEAVGLLAARAKIEPDAGNTPSLEKICTLLNRLPLALATVGNAIRENEVSLGQALAALEAIRPAAQTPNKAAVERSLRLAEYFLSPEETQMLAFAAASPAVSTSREWLEGAAGGSAASQKLENLGLLQANSPRLRLHAEYAPYVLEGYDPETLRSHMLASLLEMLASRALDFAWIKDELGNILGLLKWAATQNRWKEVIALVRAVDPYLTLRGLWAAWESALELAQQAAAQLGDLPVQAWALHQMGTRCIGTGEIDQALSQLKQALSMRLAQGDQAGSAYTRHNLRLLGYSDGDAEETPENPFPGPGAAVLGQATAGSAVGEAALPPARKGRSRSTLVLVALLLVISSIAALGGLVYGGVIKLPPGWQIPGLQSEPPVVVAEALASPSPSPSLSPSPTFTLTLTPTTLPTATSTFTPTSRPSQTPTHTLQPSETPTPTQASINSIAAVPNPSGTAQVFPTFIVSVNQANCRYGPGTAYLYANGLFGGDTGEIRGRNRQNTWYLLRLDKDGTWCWGAANTIEPRGDPAIVDITQPTLPHTTDTSPPTNVTAERNGPQVTITWDQVHINLEDARGYLLELTVCQNTLRIPYILQTDDVSYSITDEAGCSRPSSGKIYAVNKRGYTDPVTIPWP